MDLCPATFRSFVVQWLAKITGHWHQLKPLASNEKVCKWKTSFKVIYVNKNFVNFIQIPTASCKQHQSYEMMLNELSNASGLINLTN